MLSFQNVETSETLPGKSKEDLGILSLGWRCPFGRHPRSLRSGVGKGKDWRGDPGQCCRHPDTPTWVLSFSIPLARFLSVSGMAVIFCIFRVQIWLVWPF